MQCAFHFLEKKPENVSIQLYEVLLLFYLNRVNAKQKFGLKFQSDHCFPQTNY